MIRLREYLTRIGRALEIPPRLLLLLGKQGKGGASNTVRHVRPQALSLHLHTTAPRVPSGGQPNGKQRNIGQPPPAQQPVLYPAFSFTVEAPPATYRVRSFLHPNRLISQRHRQLTPRYIFTATAPAALPTAQVRSFARFCSFLHARIISSTSRTAS